MHRIAALAAVLAGCTFTTNEAGPTPDGGHGGPTGTGPGSGSDSPVTRGCHVSDPSLALCFDFEEPQLAPSLKDGSLRGHDATTANVHPMARATEQAAAVAVATGSQIYIPPSADLSSFTTLTLEAWVRPDVVGTGAWAINHQPQYGLSYDGQTAICQIGNQTAAIAFRTAAGTWTHVGCIYDGDQIKLFVNGSAVACNDGPGNIDSRSWSTYLGPQLTGGIDNVRIYDDVLDAQEICDHAGATSCQTSCPQ